MQEGFYAFYYTGVSGSGQILTCLTNGRIVGIDPAGGVIKGEYSVESGVLNADCTFTFPAGAELVTGQTLTQSTTISTKFVLPLEFFQGTVSCVDIGLGPMNARGVFVAELPS